MKKRTILNEVMSDERLDYLADIFLGMQVREFTGVPFVQFLRDPEHYTQVACKLCLAYRLRGLQYEMQA